jgi:hypothetical protein
MVRAFLLGKNNWRDGAARRYGLPPYCLVTRNFVVRAAPIAALSFRPRGSGNPAPPGCRSRPCRLQRDTRLPQTRRVRMPRGRKLTKSLLPRELRQPPRPLVRLRSRRRMAPAAASSIPAQRRAPTRLPGGPEGGSRAPRCGRTLVSDAPRLSSPPNDLKSLANLIGGCDILQNSGARRSGTSAWQKNFPPPGPRHWAYHR